MPCLFTRLPAFLAATLWGLYVIPLSPPSDRISYFDGRLQTSQLPKDDRYSVSLKEYLAEIDVCMGGRVAEELSPLFPCYASGTSHG